MSKFVVVIAWALVVAVGLFGIASIYLAIWQESPQWMLTAFSSCAIAAFGAIGASSLTEIALESK